MLLAQTRIVGEWGGGRYRTPSDALARGSRGLSMEWWSRRGGGSPGSRGCGGNCWPTGQLCSPAASQGGQARGVVLSSNWRLNLCASDRTRGSGSCNSYSPQQASLRRVSGGSAVTSGDFKDPGCDVQAVTGVVLLEELPAGPRPERWQDSGMHTDHPEAERRLAGSQQARGGRSTQPCVSRVCLAEQGF